MSGTSQRFVAYERVSTKRQGASGLGLAAQRKAIDDFLASRGAEVIARFTEVESGKLANRPELAKALHLAKVTGATLLIAKLDRLSRNAAFLLTLRDSGVRFVAADMPEANDLTVGIMALVAEQEREAISRRTREQQCSGLVRDAGSEDCVERDDEFAQDRGDGELVRFSGIAQTAVEAAETAGWVANRGGRGHPERVAQGLPAATAGGAALPSSALTRVRCDAGQGGNRAFAQAAELGHVGHQRGDRNRADPRYRPHQPRPFDKRPRVRDECRDPPVQRVDLGAEAVPAGLDQGDDLRRAGLLQLTQIDLPALHEGLSA
jgi:hypothetical protein